MPLPGIKGQVRSEKLILITRGGVKMSLTVGPTNNYSLNVGKSSGAKVNPQADEEVKSAGSLLSNEYKINDYSLNISGFLKSLKHMQQSMTFPHC